MALLGGVRDVPANQNSGEVESLARFAVDEHNIKEVHLSLSLSLDYAARCCSNSLFPYELQEVVHANAEVTVEASKFNMLLKLKRGDKEEKFKVEVHKNHEGATWSNTMTNTPAMFICNL
ncbi:unnamed protein product [Brassica oleracea]